MILFEELIDQYAIVETLAKFLNFQDIQNLLFVDKQSLFSFRHFDNKIDAEYPVLKKWKKSENAIRTLSKNYPSRSFWSPWTWKTKDKIVHFPILGVIARLWFAPQINEVYLELSSNHIKSTVFIPTPSNEAFDLSIISINMLLISASPVQDNRILNISNIIETQTIKWLLYDEISPASIPSHYHGWSLCRNYYYHLCYSVMKGNYIDLRSKSDYKSKLLLPIDKILSDWREKQNYAIEKLYLQIIDEINMISLGARISKWKDEKRMLCFLLQRKNGSDYVWELLENFLLLNDFQVFDNDCVPVYCQIFKRFEILTTNGQPISEINENKIY